MPFFHMLKDAQSSSTNRAIWIKHAGLSQFAKQLKSSFREPESTPLSTRLSSME